MAGEPANALEPHCGGALASASIMAEPQHLAMRGSRAEEADAHFPTHWARFKYRLRRFALAVKRGEYPDLRIDPNSSCTARTVERALRRLRTRARAMSSAQRAFHDPRVDKRHPAASALRGDLGSNEQLSHAQQAASRPSMSSHELWPQRSRSTASLVEAAGSRQPALISLHVQPQWDEPAPSEPR